MSDNFSKIKIGTKGIYNNMPFIVVSQIKIRDVYGFWNEWFIKFENGTKGILTDILNDFSIFIPYEKNSHNFLKKYLNISFQEVTKFPKFEKIILDRYYEIGLINYLSTKITKGLIEEKYGEIDFNLNEHISIALFKRDNFLMKCIVDKDEQPHFYMGEPINEFNLNLFNIQTLESIHNKTGDFKGKLSGFSCPKCSSPNPKILGYTHIAFCRSCGFKLDIKTHDITLFKNGDVSSDRSIVDITLQCGNTANIDGNNFIVVGVLLKDIKLPERTEQIVEYFLYQEGGHGLFEWIVENRTTGKWYLSIQKSLNSKIDSSIVLKNKLFTLESNQPYVGNTKAAWGCFPFDIFLNNDVQIFNYIHDNEINFLIRKQLINNNFDYEHQEIIYQTLEEIPLKTIIKYFHISKAHIVRHRN